MNTDATHAATLMNVKARPHLYYLASIRMKPIQYSLVAFHLALPALAQYNIDQCTRLIDDYDNGNSTLNATGVESFRFPQQDDWYMSVTLEFMQARNTSTVRDLNSLARRNVFLSVPESFAGSLEANGTDLCFYGVLKGVNATASDDGHSCNGVLSQQCLDAMSNASHSTGSRCPRIELPDECEITIGWTCMLIAFPLETMPAEKSLTICSCSFEPHVRPVHR